MHRIQYLKEIKSFFNFLEKLRGGLYLEDKGLQQQNLSRIMNLKSYAIPCKRIRELGQVTLNGRFARKKN